MEVGDFIEYKSLLLAIISINPKKHTVSALCYQNGKMATLNINDEDIKVVKKRGCERTVRYINDLMKEYLMFGDKEDEA